MEKYTVYVTKHHEDQAGTMQAWFYVHVSACVHVTVCMAKSKQQKFMSYIVANTFAF